uniref:Cytochrome b-c1 complex subunit 7 n=1 Tax=Rhodosorus marinus TaxID=101924 RepID=A0A7S0BII8_9RHOD|mmetsp:Transcript_17318/g.24831  ORF Transcript_17318/g.24831 Transcript_17318/m.24831 type:complete len:119 (+) Transcript_17318:221-577(+)
MQTGRFDKFLQLPGVRSLWNPFRAWHRRFTERQLKSFGLLMDDCLNEYEPVVAEVLKKLPKEELIMREKRIKRAFDISIKKTELHPDHQDYDVWRPYITSRINAVQKQMADEKLYQRD